MSLKYWHQPLYLLHDADTGLLAGSEDCCCETETTNSDMYYWHIRNAEMPNEYASADYAFGNLNIPSAAFGDVSHCNAPFGPKRLAHVVYGFVVNAAPGHVFANAEIEFDLFTTQIIHPPVCGTPIDLNIVGWDVANAPPFLSLSASEWENVRKFERTTAEVAWATHKVDLQCGDLTLTTPNIAAIVNEIVGRPDWVSGNTIAIIVEGQLQEIRPDWMGVATLNKFDGTLIRGDGGDWLADGFRVGQLLTVRRVNGVDFPACVRQINGGELFWGPGTPPADWPVNGDEWVSIQVNPVSSPGLPGAVRPATSLWDYVILTTGGTARHTLRRG